MPHTFLAGLLPDSSPPAHLGLLENLCRKVAGCLLEPKLALRVCMRVDKHSSGHMVGYICWMDVPTTFLSASW